MDTHIYDIYKYISILDSFLYNIYPHTFILVDTHIYDIYKYISILDSFLYNISLYTEEHQKKPLLNSKDETDSWLVTFWPKDGEREG